MIKSAKKPYFSMIFACQFFIFLDFCCQIQVKWQLVDCKGDFWKTGLKTILYNNNIHFRYFLMDLKGSQNYGY